MRCRMDAMLKKFQEKESRRFKLKVGVFALIVEDGKVLLLRRYQTGTQDGMYVLPMGGHDGKEPITSCLIREVKEEINLDVQAKDLQVCHVMHRLHSMPQGLSFEQVDVIFAVKAYEGSLHNNEPDKCDELAYFPLDHLPKSLAPFMKHAIEAIQNGQFYSEYGWE